MLSPPLLVTITLFFTLPFIFFFAPQILPPPPFTFTIPDDLDDLALFTRASRAATHSISTTSHLATTNPKPKIAFLFLTNSNLSFAPLWDKFLHGNLDLFNIYIHSDPSIHITPPGGVFHDRFIPSKKTFRSSPSLIAATRRLLAHALIDDPMNQYFALVSQHCIPLHSFRFLYSSLFGNRFAFPRPDYYYYKSFIEILADEPNLYERYAARGEHALLPEVKFDEFRVGSQFFVLTRGHAVAVVRERRLWRKFRVPCVTEEPCYPEEHYFPTVLSMEDPNGCMGFTLTRVNWTGCWDGHPRLYLPDEVSSLLIFQLRQSNFSRYDYMFARKFSPECLAPLMNIADGVIFRD